MQHMKVRERRAKKTVHDLYARLCADSVPFFSMMGQLLLVKDALFRTSYSALQCRMKITGSSASVLFFYIFYDASTIKIIVDNFS